LQHFSGRRFGPWQYVTQQTRKDTSLHTWLHLSYADLHLGVSEVIIPHVYVDGFIQFNFAQQNSLIFMLDFTVADCKMLIIAILYSWPTGVLLRTH
jgi:hypothetical protein